MLRIILLITLLNLVDCVPKCISKIRTNRTKDLKFNDILHRMGRYAFERQDIRKLFLDIRKASNKIELVRKYFETNTYLDIILQDFNCTNETQTFTGTNVIGLLKGKYYKMSHKNYLHEYDRKGILVVGTHAGRSYEMNTPCGDLFDNNYSGLTALLSLAVNLAEQTERTTYRTVFHTVMFVAFDQAGSYPHAGYGSYAFLQNFLLSDYLGQDQHQFLGAIILDRIGNFNPEEGSQEIPYEYIERNNSTLGVEVDMFDSNGELIQLVKNTSRGDFVAVIFRNQNKFCQSCTDNTIANHFMNYWNSLADNGYYARQIVISHFNETKGRDEIEAFLKNYPTLTSSDHQSFWFPCFGYPEDKCRKALETNFSLPAIFITDTMNLRSVSKQCTANPTDPDVKFMQEIITSTSRLVYKMANTIQNDRVAKKTLLLVSLICWLTTILLGALSLFIFREHHYGYGFADMPTIHSGEDRSSKDRFSESPSRLESVQSFFKI